MFGCSALSALFLTLLALAIAGPAQGQTTAPPQASSATIAQGSATNADRNVAPLVTAFTEGLAKGLDGLTVLPDLLSGVDQAWRTGRGTLTSGAAAGLLSATVGIGSVVAFLLIFLLRHAARRRLVVAGADFAARLRAGWWQLAIESCGLAAFGIVGYLAVVSLVPPTATYVRLVGFALLGGVAGFGGYLVAGRFLFAPGRPERRLMPLPRADGHMRALLIYGLIGPLFTQSIVVLGKAPTDQLALAGWSLVGETLLTIYKITWFWIGRRDIAALVGGDNRAGQADWLRWVGGAVLPWFYIIVALALWAFAQVAASTETDTGPRLAAVAGVTQTLIVVLPILVAGASALARSLGRRVLVGREGPLALALAAVAGTMTTGIVCVGSLALLVGLWSGILAGSAGADALAALRVLTRAGAAIVTGWSVWTFAWAYFDAQAPTPHSATSPIGEPNHHPVASRLATVLPLLRNIVLGAVLAVTALVVLSTVGIETTPFLAGFGVIGLAISFGSQALVRDIVSGIFFMADDAFRVGEYIDTGQRAGTVEQITIRSIQLRHQNGQVHTIPFGQLQVITNSSRDWSTVKFLLRLDRETEPAHARAVIKRVGIEMMNDPDTGGEILQPLVMQGISEIADNALVIRCKFTCKPFKQNTHQRDVLDRLHRAFAAETIYFPGSKKEETKIKSEESAVGPPKLVTQGAAAPAQPDSTDGVDPMMPELAGAALNEQRDMHVTERNHLREIVEELRLTNDGLRSIAAGLSISGAKRRH